MTFQDQCNLFDIEHQFAPARIEILRIGTRTRATIGGWVTNTNAYLGRKRKRLATHSMWEWSDHPEFDCLRAAQTALGPFTVIMHATPEKNDKLAFIVKLDQ